MIEPYPVPLAHEEPLAGVTRSLALRALEFWDPEESDLEACARLDGVGGDTEGFPPGTVMGRFEGDSLPQLSGRIYGGQVLGQAVLAAAACFDTTPGDSYERQLHALHTYFVGGGNPERAVQYEVEALRDGRSFSQRQVRASQDGRNMATVIASFQKRQDGIDLYEPMPKVPGPDELVSALAIFRNVDHPVARFLGRTAAFDVRHVEGNLYLQPPKQPDSHQHVWIKVRGTVPASATQMVHRAILAYVCDQIMLEPALRSQGLSWRSPGMSLATLDHAQWFHRDVNVNDWLLFVQDSPSSSGGRAAARALVYNQAGKLVSSISQEGMIRIPHEGQKSSGNWAVQLDG